MNKAEMIKNVSNKIEGMTQKDIDTVLSAYVDVIKETLSNNKDAKVVLPGIGAFTVKHVPERTGIVQMGENKNSTWTKAAHDELTFKISKSIREII